jgi:class 3 adenylate cyclase
LSEQAPRLFAASKLSQPFLVGLHPAGVDLNVGRRRCDIRRLASGSVGSATARCSELCDAAEGGQIFVSRETARLLQDEDLGELLLRNLGERQTRRTQRPVGAYELVVPSDAPSN